MDMCIGMCMGMCMDMRIDMRMDMRVDMCMAMCMDMCIDMCCRCTLHHACVRAWGACERMWPCERRSLKCNVLHPKVLGYDGVRCCRQRYAPAAARTAPGC